MKEDIVHFPKFRPVKSRILDQIDFSLRELEILQLIAEGLTNLQMSEKFFLSKRTIEGHRQSL
ncbi:LuxR C-terminal-related transcriptional regulator [Pedobacter sp. MW01-1-1]|uniref:LuxR C-terminal-related transcriptional regulator n=1 Tax=Pedobacter sp. MW01-1-1 TaxID=3383027 RepID=UPI003FF06980